MLLRNQVVLLGDALKRPDEALAAAREILKRRPNDTRARLSLAVIFARTGEVAQAQEICEDLKSNGTLRPIDHLQLACVYALCADGDEDTIKQSLGELKVALLGEPRLAIKAVKDSDLASLKELPDFRRYIAAAATLIRPSKH